MQADSSETLVGASAKLRVARLAIPKTDSNDSRAVEREIEVKNRGNQLQVLGSTGDSKTKTYDKGLG